MSVDSLAVLPPFWRLKTSVLRDADGKGEIILSVEGDYIVMVNNRPVTLPSHITTTDTVRLEEAAKGGLRETSSSHRRWRSARRRSNEKSARAIRRETPPFWRLKTSVLRDADGKGEIILSVEGDYIVMVNDCPVTLPWHITTTDTVRLQEEATMQNVRTKARKGTTRYKKAPPQWLTKGAVLHYCSVIGDPPTKLHCTVLEAPFQVNGGQWVTLIDKHRGWVACEALVQPSESPGS